MPHDALSARSERTRTVHNPGAPSCSTHKSLCGRSRRVRAGRSSACACYNDRHTQGSPPVPATRLISARNSAMDDAATADAGSSFMRLLRPLSSRRLAALPLSQPGSSHEYIRNTHYVYMTCILMGAAVISWIHDKNPLRRRHAHDSCAGVMSRMNHVHDGVPSVCMTPCA